MSEGEIVAEYVLLDDLYHPHTMEHYDPECCCAFCWDVSLVKERRELAAWYRAMRKESTRKARFVWRAVKQRDAILKGYLIDNLFKSDPNANAPASGLQKLFAELTD